MISYLLATASGSFDVLGLIAQIGLGGIIAAPFIYVWRKAEERADLSEKKNNDIVELMTKDFIPTLIRTQDAMKAYDAGLTAALNSIKDSTSRQLDLSQMAEVIRLLNRLDTK